MKLSNPKPLQDYMKKNPDADASEVWAAALKYSADLVRKCAYDEYHFRSNKQENDETQAYDMLTGGNYILDDLGLKWKDILNFQRDILDKHPK